jgi:hypothetical protein
MKYEGPELTALTPAIDAIQTTKGIPGSEDATNPVTYDSNSFAYQDWE